MTKKPTHRFTETARQILHRYSRPGASDTTQVEIGEEFKRNRATINGHCARLVRLGYLEKLGHGHYTITAEGRARLARRSGAAAACVLCPSCGRRVYL